MIHIYCGDGKGKTTAALGLALRYTGYGKQVVIAQFQKTTFSGELKAIRQLPNICLLRVAGEVQGFSWELTEAQRKKRQAEHEHLLQQAIDQCRPPCLLILDEVISAVNTNCLKEEMVVDYLKQLPDGLEVVLTGRDPSKSFCDQADYITEMKKWKHPMDRGVYAREGIEY